MNLTFNKFILFLILYIYFFSNISAQPQWWNDRVQQGKLLSTTVEPSNLELMPSVGNGFLAYQIGNNPIYMSGLFNGFSNALTNPSHRAALPNLQYVLMASPDLTLAYAGLDLENATYTRHYVSNKYAASVTQTYYAHQTYRNILIQEITIDNSQSNVQYELDLETINIYSNLSNSDVVVTSNVGIDVSEFMATIIQPELEGGFLSSVAIVTSTVPNAFAVIAGQVETIYFMTVITSNLEDPNYVDQARNIYKAFYPLRESLLDTHINSWSDIWNSRIEIGGNLELAQVVNASLYYILSSIRSDWPWSLSPGGLASNGYHGHTFWDTETWMYPPILTLHSDLARDALIQYRVDRINEAHLKALSYDENYTGYMFPWESAFSGTETCPTVAPTGLFEQHITGDISFAFKQYYYLTGDYDWLLHIGYPVIKGMAEFWASRVSLSPSSQPDNPVYDINLIIPPDEYAVGVNNSVYTNVIAKYAIEWAIEAASLVQDNSIPVEQWQSIASNLVILFNETSQMHPEYQGYSGETIKQADVILLGYPLQFNMSEQVRKNDLVYYQKKTDVNGPAMTYSMFVVSWLELENETMAEESWSSSYSNSQQPFGVWTETPTGGTVNFITGAGGFLQSILNGYMGLRINRDGLLFNPKLPPNTPTMKVNSIDYQGSEFNVYWDQQQIIVELVTQSVYDPVLQLTTSSTESILSLNNPITLNAGTQFIISLY